MAKSCFRQRILPGAFHQHLDKRAKIYKMHIMNICKYGRFTPIESLLFSMTLLEYLLKDKEGQKKGYFGGKKVAGFVFFSTIFCKNLPWLFQFTQTSLSD